jgi:hypothetical protein
MKTCGSAGAGARHCTFPSLSDGKVWEGPENPWPGSTFSSLSDGNVGAGCSEGRETARFHRPTAQPRATPADRGPQWCGIRRAGRMAACAEEGRGRPPSEESRGATRAAPEALEARELFPPGAGLFCCPKPLPRCSMTPIPGACEPTHGASEPTHGACEPIPGACVPTPGASVPAHGCSSGPSSAARRNARGTKTGPSLRSGPSQPFGLVSEQYWP